MEYKIIVSHSGEDLSKKVSELIKEGWTPIGSHQVQIRHHQNRFRGTQHVDTLNDMEYSQTLVKKDEPTENELISVLKTLREDAEMALSGEWDRTDSGFEAQIHLIDNTLKQ